MKIRAPLLWLVLACALGAGRAPLAAQIGQDGFRNLRHFPPDIARDSLIEVMRGFSFALGVRCQYCHVGGDGVSFEGVVFESDDDPDKRKARFMLGLVDTLNEGLLPTMADRDEPASAVSCKTCHRGRPKPESLADVLRRTLDQHGPDSLTVRYRALRDEMGLRGTYDFGEWEVNVLAEQLAREGRPRDAIAVYELNLEQFPTSLSIVLALGALHEEVGEVESAVTYYERVLELAPQNATARSRLAALRGASDTGRQQTRYTNLHVLPDDVSQAELAEVMLANLSGLGLPRRGGEGCLHCHVGSIDVDRNEWDYASDEKPEKLKARVMMAMVRDINEGYLARLGERADPAVEVGCHTCHAGRANPMPLADLLMAEHRTGGLDALVATYRELRARYYEADAYDFRVHTLVDVADRLAEAGANDDAAAVHALNIEHTGDERAHAGLIRLRLVEALGEGGVPGMTARYRELRRTRPSEGFTPATLDVLGWSLFRSGRQEAGLALFELNFVEHSDAFAAHESLAYAVSAMGDPERGFAIAERWLSEHPGHGPGLALLTELRR